MSDEKVETIRKRHIRLGSQLGNRSTGLTAFEADVAHQDRATLLSALSASEARAEAAEAKLAEALLNPVSAAPSPAPDEVEAVARAINPRAWDVMDYELRETQKKYAGQNVAWSVSQFQHAESMDQARAAIAALRQRAAMDRLLRMDGELYDVPNNQEPRND